MVQDALGALTATEARADGVSGVRRDLRALGEAFEDAADGDGTGGLFWAFHVKPPPDRGWVRPNARARAESVGFPSVLGILTLGAQDPLTFRRVRRVQR